MADDGKMIPVSEAADVIQAIILLYHDEMNLHGIPMDTRTSIAAHVNAEIQRIISGI